MDCRQLFNERIGTLMARLRSSNPVVSYAISARTDGMGGSLRRTFGKSHVTIKQARAD